MDLDPNRFAVHRVHAFLATYGHINSGVYQRNSAQAGNLNAAGGSSVPSRQSCKEASEHAPIETEGIDPHSGGDECSIDNARGLAGGVGGAVRGKKRVVVIGAGVSGLSAARQLQAFGYEVLNVLLESFCTRKRAMCPDELQHISTMHREDNGWSGWLDLTAHLVQVVVLEARDRMGGRIHSEKWGRGGEGSIDCGAMIITGVYANPIAMLCRQLGIDMIEIATRFSAAPGAWSSRAGWG